MKILFIYPDLNIDVAWKGCYYEGIASLSAMLKSKGHMTDLIHVYNIAQAENLLEKIPTDSNVIAFSCTTPMFPFVRYYSKIIKKYFKNIPILCGGMHATSVPKEVLKNDSIDYVCMGEGEYFILDFLDYIQGSRSINDIKNLAYISEEGEVVINELRPPITPLDSLPFPDREIFASHHRNEDLALVAAGRGCPYRCAYCANDYLNKIYSNKYFRLRKPETVIEEIKLLQQQYPSIRQLSFLDDVFASDEKWLSIFCDLYKKLFNRLPFMATAYPATITDEKIRLLKEAGCVEINFGVQSGNEAIRNNVMLRHVSNNKIEQAIRILKKYDIKFLGDVIFGVPSENKKQMLDTIKFCAKNGIKSKSHIFYPLPATRLAQLSIEKGLLGSNIYGEDYHSKTILKYSSLHRARILFFHRYSNFMISVYRIFGYSQNIWFPGKICISVLDHVVFNDIVIWLVIKARAAAIKIRSFIRRICGVREYQLKWLQ